MRVTDLFVHQPARRQYEAALARLSRREEAQRNVGNIAAAQDCHELVLTLHRQMERELAAERLSGGSW